MTTLIWFSVGLLAGWGHATALWRSTHRFSLWSPLIGFLRMGIVAASLVAAALSGAILFNAAGWATGFTSLALILAMRPTRTAVAASSVTSREPR